VKYFGFKKKKVSWFLSLGPSKRDKEGGDDAELPHLPAELWSHVLSFVGGHDLVAFAATNWRAHALATRPFLWRS
jgi:hypothetical protein